MCLFDVLFNGTQSIGKLLIKSEYILLKSSLRIVDEQSPLYKTFFFIVEFFVNRFNT